MMVLLVLASTRAQAQVQVIYIATSATTNGGIVPPGGTLEAGINYTVKANPVKGDGGDTVTKVELMEGTSVLNSKVYKPRFTVGDKGWVLNDKRGPSTLSANLAVGSHVVFLRSTTYYGEKGDSPSYSVNVNSDGLLPQSITFPAISNRTVDSGAFEVSATASSGLPVSFISANTAVCTIAGSTVTLISTGTCTIAANQDGNNAYAAAGEVTQSFQIIKVAYTTPANPDRLMAGETLLPGEYIESPNGAAQLLMRYDGNLVLYRLEDDYPVWSTDTAGHPLAYAILRSDGNLVVYSADGQTPLFNTGTFTPGSTLVLQADENLVLLPPEQPGNVSSMQAAIGTVGMLWASNTSVPNPPEPGDLDTDRLPLDPGPEVPSTDQNACTQDEEFWQVDGPGDNSIGLKNRHVLCVKQRFTEGIDLWDSEGIPHWNAGTMTLDALWSVHGVHNKLEKHGTLTLRYAYTPRDEMAAPALNVIAKISCIPEPINPQITCEQQMPMVTLANGAQSTREAVIPLTWSNENKKITNVLIDVTLLYTTDGTTPVKTPDGSGSTRGENPYFAAWWIRCDIDQLRPGWKGCVFPDAAAVWVPDESTKTKYSRQHIAYVFENMANVPGRYKKASTSRSQAEIGGQFNPLIRTGSELNEANRSWSKKRCIKLEPDPQYCATGVACDCDEYPFASSEEGAYEKEDFQYSVRKIPYWDNRKAGAQLGGMYAKERVLLGDKFWVKVD
jgi:hypothetical protein